MKFRDRSIQKKLGVMTLVVIAVPLLIFYATITILYNRAIVNRSEQQIKENLKVMSDRVERVINDGVLCSNYLTLNINTIDSENGSHQVDVDNKIRSVMNQSLLIFGGIDSIVYIAADETMYSTNYSLYNKRNAILGSSYFRVTKEVYNGSTTLFDMESDCMQTKDIPVATLGKRIVNFKTGELIGYLFINLDTVNLEQSMTNEITNYYLYDNSGNPVAMNIFNENITESLGDDMLADNEHQKFKINGHSYLLDSISLELGWTLVGVTDLNAYNISTLQLFRTFLVAAVLTAILFVFLALAIFRMIIKPLDQLKEGAMEIAKGNLDVEFDFKNNDEIGVMGGIFNHMTREIKKLLGLVEEEAKKKRAYELALVQEQVKPHFLYNTLDIIIMLIEMNRPKDASRVTKKLADYYKTSLSSSDEVITLEKEIRIVQDYLDLQLMRYQDKFTYEIDVDSSLSWVMVPKLTLQPLIENAIYHGLKYKEGWGNIYLGAKLVEASLPDSENGSDKTTGAADQTQGDFIEITVSDDGVGMDPDMIKQLLDTEKFENHFGVYSVNQRLKLYYGSAYSLKIVSEKGEGTTFTIRIPMDWKEETC